MFDDPDFLYKLFKDLGTHAPIYINAMTDPNNLDTYVVIEPVQDVPTINGDGKVLLRTIEFNVRIHTSNANDGVVLAKLYEAILDENDITYNRYGPTIDPLSKRFSILIMGEYYYGK